MKRFVMLLVGAGLVGGSAFALVAVRGGDGPPAPGVPSLSFVIYRSPTCSCCKQYEAYLRDRDVSVRSVEIEDTSAFKREHGIPEDVWSCHTSMVGDYIVEGHVPLEVVERLLAERPDVDGIALPGMPAGAPGQPGVKEGPFEVVTFSGETVDPYATV